MRIRIRISLSTLDRLIFFSFSLIFAACLHQEDPASKKITILWKDERAIALSIPISNFKNIPDDSIIAKTSVRLSGTRTSIAGHFRREQESLVFEPLIPLTRGLNYQILINADLLAQIKVPRSTTVPELIAIYPSRDTVPENLLKIYLVFSKPMREGNSLDFVSLLNERGDSLPHSFLSFNPELWNPDRTILTLWFDPGRIKRDLQPNKTLGAPLVNGRKYRLIISADWQDQQGNTLKQAHIKSLVVSLRDSLCPAPDHWNLRLPISGSLDSLGLYFHEPLDYLLMFNCIRFLDEQGRAIEGSMTAGEGETSIFFTPIGKWKRGTYTVQIESRLEDLAGNNLNRPFDRDLKKESGSPRTRMIYERKFQIH